MRRRLWPATNTPAGPAAPVIVELQVISAHFPNVPTDTYDDDGVTHSRLDPYDDGDPNYVPGLGLTLENVRGKSLILDNLIEETAESVAQHRADEVFLEVFENFYRQTFERNLQTELARPGRDAEIAADEVQRDLERRTFVYNDYDNPQHDEDGCVIDATRVERVFDTVAECEAAKAKYDAEEDAKIKAKNKAKAEAHLKASNNVVPLRGGDDDAA
jgi:hypothetical protein